MSDLVLIAVGGNALIHPGESGSAEQQFRHAMDTASAVVRVLKAGYRVVLTHGNGPQVGAALARSELAAASAYRLPYDCCVAATQGEIGYVLQYALWQAMQQEQVNVPVVSLVTQVRVDNLDPAFTHPSKPVGPYYSELEATQYREKMGWAMRKDGSGKYRRVVPSPLPLEIVELEAIRACVDRGLVVIAAGGGGVPVFNDHDISKGVEAVIDKDITSSLLAAQLGVRLFAIATAEEYIYLNYQKESQRILHELTVMECSEHLAAGQFPAGSMGPKVEAAMQFVTRGGERAIITDAPHLLEAINGTTGTQIVPDR